MSWKPPIVKVPPWKCPHCGDEKEGYCLVYDAVKYGFYDSQGKLTHSEFEEGSLGSSQCENCGEEVTIERE